MSTQTKTRLSVLFLSALFIISSVCINFDYTQTEIVENKINPIHETIELANDIPIWNYTYDAGGNNQDDRGYSITETSDGGFVAAGEVKNSTTFKTDMWILRVDANGTEVWNTTIDNGSSERAYDIIEVSSGGFAACGFVRRNISTPTFYNFFYLVRFDDAGNVAWMKNYTGNYDCEAKTLTETDDGGFILVGKDNYGGGMYVVRTDADGVLTWETTISDGDNLAGYGVSDLSGTNGYIIAATMEETVGEDDFSYFYLLKLDESGSHVWNSTHGAGAEECFGMTESLDGGYVLGGRTTSWGSGGYDMYLVKFDGSGDHQWNQTYGGSEHENCESVTVTIDGGFALAGYALGTGDDIWIVRTDSEGESLWTEKIHNSGDERAAEIIEVNDGGYALTGYVDPSSGDNDLCIYRLSEPRWDPEPISKALELGEALYYDINATSTDGPLIWSINDTAYLSIDSAGILQNTSSLPIGEIPIEIKIEDSHGHWIQAEFTITVTWVYSDLKFIYSNWFIGINAMTQAPDGGFVFACSAQPFMGDAKPWIVKYNDVGGQMWNELFEDSYLLIDIITCSDGGYAAVGRTWAAGEPDTQVWLLRIDENGQQIWNSTFRALDFDSGKSLVETEDGGFLLLGSTHEALGGKTDFWLIRTDSGGNHIWNTTYGYPSATEEGYAIASCTSGGYALAGVSDGTGSGNDDAWLVRIDNDGNQLWNQSYGGADVHLARDVIEDTDGGFVLTGEVTVVGESFLDAFIIRTNETGHTIWNYTYGGDDDDQCDAIVQVHDGSFVAAGETHSNIYGNRNAYFLQVDLDGNVLVNESYGDFDGYESFNDIIEVKAGGVAMGGTFSIAGHLYSYAYFVQRPMIKWTETPTNQDVELGDPFFLQLKASSAVGVRNWWVDDQTNFDISYVGLLTNTISLPVGDYPLTIRAYDCIHNMIQASITVSVIDTTDPEWTETPVNIVLDYDTIWYYDVNATDLSGIATYFMNDTVNFDINSTGYLTNNTFLEAGVYRLNVSVQDNHGNVLSELIEISVNEEVVTTTTTTTTTTTSTTTTTDTLTSDTSTTTTLPPDIMVIALLGLGALGAVVVIAILVKKRR